MAPSLLRIVPLWLRRAMQADIDALHASFKYAEFLADAKKLDFEINPTTGDELAAIVERIYATPKAIVQRAAQARK